MAPRELDRLVHSAARSAGPDHVFPNPRLRHQVDEGDVHVAGPFLADLLELRERELRVRRAAAVAVAAIVHGQDVEAFRGEIRSQAVPGRSIAVALMEKEDSGSGLV